MRLPVTNLAEHDARSVVLCNLYVSPEATLQGALFAAVLHTAPNRVAALVLPLVKLVGDARGLRRVHVLVQVDLLLHALREHLARHAADLAARGVFVN